MAGISNAEWTRNLVKSNPKMETSMLVTRIEKHTGMETSGARTYLQNARRILGMTGQPRKVAAKKRPAKKAVKKAVKKKATKKTAKKRAPAKPKATTSMPTTDAHPATES